MPENASARANVFTKICMLPRRMHRTSWRDAQHRVQVYPKINVFIKICIPTTSTKSCIPLCKLLQATTVKPVNVFTKICIARGGPCNKTSSPRQCLYKDLPIRRRRKTLVATRPVHVFKQSSACRHKRNTKCMPPRMRAMCCAVLCCVVCVSCVSCLCV